MPYRKQSATVIYRLVKVGQLACYLSLLLIASNAQRGKNDLQNPTNKSQIEETDEQV